MMSKLLNYEKILMRLFENYDSYTQSVLAKLRRLKLFIESLKSTERACLILLMQRDLQRQKFAKAEKRPCHALKQDALNYSVRGNVSPY